MAIFRKLFNGLASPVFSQLWDFASGAGLSFASGTLAAFGFESPWISESTALDQLSGRNSRVQQPGRCLDLDGSTQYITVPKFDFVTVGGTYCMMAWVNVDNVTALMGLFDINNGTSDRHGVIIMPTTGNIRAGQWNGSAYEGTRATVDATPGVWQHICYTYDNEVYKLYVDGVDVSGAGGPSSLGAGTNGIGFTSNGAGYLDGRISDPVIMTRIPTDAEILAVATQGVSPRTVVAGQPTDMGMWLDMAGNRTDGVYNFGSLGSDFDGTIVGGTTGMLYEGKDVPNNRQNLVGYSPAVNMFRNTSFDGGVDGDPGTKPTGWDERFWSTYNITKTFVDNTVQFTSTLTGRSALTKNFTTVAGQKYNLSVDVFITTYTTLDIDRYVGDALIAMTIVAQRVDGVDAINLTEGVWQTVSVDFTTATATAIRIGFGAGVTSNITTIDVTFRNPQLKLGYGSATFQANPTQNYLEDGTFVPLLAADPTTDVLGNVGQHTGVAAINGALVDSPCLTFDGVDDEVVVPSDAALDITGAIEVEFNIVTQDSGNQGFVGKSAGYFGSNAAKVYEVGYLSGTIYWQISDGTTSSLVSDVNATIHNGLPHTVKATWDGTTDADGMKLYLDGVEIATGTSAITAMQVKTEDLNIGGSGAYFSASSMYNVIIRDDSVVVASWPLSEKSGMIAHDVSGSGNHGTLTGMVESAWDANTQDDYHSDVANGWSPSSGYVLGTPTGSAYTQSLKFDGVDDVVVIDSDNPEVTVTGTYTVAVWTRLTGYGIVFSMGSGNLDRNVIGVSGTNLICEIYDGAYTIEGGGAYPIDDAWHHIAFTNNAGTLALYLDGVAVSGAGAQLSTINPSNVWGARGPAAIQSQLDSRLSDGRVYDVVKTPAEVLAMVTTPDSTNLILHHTFDGNVLDEVASNDGTLTNFDPPGAHIPSDGSGVDAQGNPVTHPAGNGLNTTTTGLVLEVEEDSPTFRGLELPMAANPFYLGDSITFFDMAIAERTASLDSQITVIEPIPHLSLHYDFANYPTLVAQVGPTLTVTRSTTASVVDYAGVFKTVNANEARHTGHRRVENLWPYSNDQTNADYAPTNGTAVRAETAPDGTATATTLNDGAVSETFHRVGRSNTSLPWMVGETTYCASMYAKAGTKNFVRLSASGNDNLQHNSYFNLTAGTALGSTSTEADEYGIELASVTIPGAASDWYRIWVVLTPSTNGSGGNVGLFSAEAFDDHSYTGNNEDVFHTWGWQLEDVSGQADKSPSEYIPTTTAAVANWYATKRRTNVFFNSFPTANGEVWGPSETDSATDPPTIFAGKNVINNGGSNGYVYHRTSPTITPYVTGEEYIMSVYVRLEDGTEPTVATDINATGNFRFYVFGTYATTVGKEELGDGWWRCWGVAVAAAGAQNGGIQQSTNHYTYSGSGLSVDLCGWQCEKSFGRTTPSAFIASESGVSVASSGFDTPLVGEGLRVEPPRTNLMTYSNDLSQWTNSIAVNTQNAGVAPDGTNTANKITDDSSGSTGSAFVFRNQTLALSTTHVASVYAKADQLDWVRIRMNAFGTLAIWAYFDLTNGVVGADVGGDNTSHDMEDVGNGWYRCWVVFESDAADASGAVLIYVAEADGDASVDLDGTSSILTWEAQVEEGNYPSSPIHTTNVAAPRDGDLVLVDDVTWLNPREGTVYASAVPNKYIVDSTAMVVAISASSSASRWATLAFRATDTMQIFGSGGNTNIVGGTTPPNTLVRSAIGLSEDNINWYVDGVLAGTDSDTGGPLPTIATTINVGSSRTDGAYLGGHVTEIRVYSKEHDKPTLEDMSNGVFPS